MCNSLVRKFSIVYYFAEPPVFDKVPRNVTTVSGEDVLLECSSSGDPNPKTRWTRVERDGSEVLLDMTRYKMVAGRGLRLKDVQPSQAGQYKCTATSSVGAVEAEVSPYRSRSSSGLTNL